MKTSILIITAVLLLTFALPIAVMHGVNLIKKGNFKSHRGIQIISFMIGLCATIILISLMPIQEEARKIIGNSSYTSPAIFRAVLSSYIISSVITYLIWTFQLLLAFNQGRDRLSGIYSIQHVFLGKILIIWLFCTAVTATAVYLMTLGWI